MEWQKLELSKASLIKKEVDAAVAQLSDDQSTNKAVLVHAIQARIQELENFYIRNNDDDRAILFEKERLRLRKALQTYNASLAPVARDSKSVTSGGFDREAFHQNSNASVTSNQKGLSSTNSRISQPSTAAAAGQPVAPTQRVTKITTTPVQSHSGNRSVSGNASVTSNSGNITKPRSSPTSAPIYAWETAQETRSDTLVVDGVNFVATAENGFYNRAPPAVCPEDGHQTQYNATAAAATATLPLSDKFYDFQLILTAEELATLASRKKSEVRSDSKLHLARAAATSVHSSTPYIENRRIINEMLRPDKQEKWVHKDGIRAYKRN